MCLVMCCDVMCSSKPKIPAACLCVVWCDLMLQFQALGAAEIANLAFNEKFRNDQVVYVHPSIQHGVLLCGNL